MPDMSPAPQINLTSAATARIAAILSRDSAPDMKLRIAVAGGGCSGFQYHFSFDPEVTGDDLVYQNGAARVVVDETSLGLLAGSVIDFVEDMAGSSFQIKNPQAKTGCGCGNSFSM
ncbi:MAG: iron-sulfur cluster insertion protein ErpA [Candidatus Symbiobacter sp.]|nr:iron-sulfur cluster insertion protein ErpA [Candidatus Symbiobacter sp.]